MNIRIKATNTTLTPAIENDINKKINRLAKFFKEEDRLFVEVEVDPRHKSGLKYRAEIDIKPKNFYAEARGNDFYEAFDLLIPKIKEQILKEKDKKVSQRRRKKGIKGIL
jgi:putative sigma-54 modulation protein